MATVGLPAVRMEPDGPVTVVTLARPARRNALDVESATILLALLAEIDADPSVRCLVLTGVERDFCTGVDIDASGIGDRDPIDYRHGADLYRDLFRRLWELETPVVSAVNGTVAGVGWMLALLADIVVAAEDARWIHVFIRRAMVPHAGDPYYLPRIIPFHRLNEIAMLSDPVASSTLHEWGVVNRAVPSDDVLPTAMSLAGRLAAGPTRSLGLTKQLYRRSLGGDLDRTLTDERAACALVSTTRDRQEGMASFREGRPAAFEGR